MGFRGAKKQYQIIQTNKLSIKQIPIREGGGGWWKSDRENNFYLFCDKSDWVFVYLSFLCYRIDDGYV